MASDTWSLLNVSSIARIKDRDRTATHAILSGWPSPTDSEVKRKVFLGATEPIVIENNRIYGKESTEGSVWREKESKTSVGKGEKKREREGKRRKTRRGTGYSINAGRKCTMARFRAVCAGRKSGRHFYLPSLHELHRYARSILYRKVIKIKCPSSAR